MEKVPKIAMTSVYMDRGEGLEYLQGQMTRMAEQNVDEYYLDFICDPSDVFKACELMREFYALLPEILPHLDMTSIYSAVTCNDKIRPAAMALIVMSGDTKIRIKDVNPGRPGR